jgi:hypothetical protein
MSDSDSLTGGRPDPGELLAEVLTGRRSDVSAIAREFGLTTLELARGVVSYRLSPSYAGDLEAALDDYGLDRDDFDAATLLASAELEDHLPVVEHLLRVYEGFPRARPILAQFARTLAVGESAMAPAVPGQLIALVGSHPHANDPEVREAMAEFALRLPAGLENFVLEEINEQDARAGRVLREEAQPQSRPGARARDVALAALQQDGPGTASVVLDYALGQLEGPARLSFEGEISSDPSLKAKCDRLVRAIDQLLDDGQVIEAPADLARRTLKFVDERGRRRRPILDFAPVTVPFRLADVAVAASVLLAGLLTLIPAAQRSKDRMVRAGCVFNLHRIGLGLAQYGYQYRRYPYTNPECPEAPAGAYAALLHEAGLLDDASVLYCPGNGPSDIRRIPSSAELCRWEETDPERLRHAFPGDYAYNVGYQESVGPAVPVRYGSSSVTPLLADQPAQWIDLSRILPGNSPNHHGRGQNVLYSDLHVSWHTTRRISPHDADMFLNARQELAPGLYEGDTVLCARFIPLRGSR